MRILGTKIIIRTAVRVLFILFLLPPAPAEELHPESEAPNLVELFVGVTHDDSDNELSVGATYERRLSAGFGVGGIGEYTADREFVLAVPFFWHPVEPWRFLVAPGTEIEDGDHEFLVRLGGSYEIEFSDWSLSPEVNLDFVDSDVVIVVGASFGWKF
jgi:hypothetical protein